MKKGQQISNSQQEEVCEVYVGVGAARGWEAGRDDVGSEVHRKEQLQHGYVTSEGMKLLKVWVHDNLAHGHLQGVLSVFKQLRAS